MAKFSRIHIAIFILILFYTVGVLGLSFVETRAYFLLLTPFNLLLTLGVLAWANEEFSKSILLPAILVFLGGYFVELAGIKTGILFGNYWYGDSLGSKVLGVPLVIGVNWLLLVFGSHAISKMLFQQTFLQYLFAAILMVLLDVVIEPVAIQLDFWQWDNNTIPIQNYVMWFLVAFAMQILLDRFSVKLKWQLGVLLFAVQFVFFGILNFSLN